MVGLAEAPGLETVVMIECRRRRGIQARVAVVAFFSLAALHIFA